jgi:hypothetical protein
MMAVVVTVVVATMMIMILVATAEATDDVDVDDFLRFLFSCIKLSLSPPLLLVLLLILILDGCVTKDDIIVLQVDNTRQGRERVRRQNAMQRQ